MFRSWRLGSAFGIPLFLHPTFFLLPLYVLFVSRDQGTLGILLTQMVLFTVFACVLFHELGHALMARVFGIRTRDITLSPIGGLARLDSTGVGPFEEILIALAGPAVNLVIVLLLVPFVLLFGATGLIGQASEGVLPIGTPVRFAAHYITLVCFGNFVLLLFNLIPAFPMDGGRVLRAILSLGMPRLSATQIAAGLGLLVALSLAVLGVFVSAPGLILVSLFVGLAGQMELFALRQHEARLRREAATVVDSELPPQPGGFTGLAWDPRRGVWVRWLNGAPIDQ